MTVPASLESELERHDARPVTSLVGKTLGFMFRREIDEALVFEFDGVATRRIHMLFVFEPLRVIWCRDGEVVQDEILEPWTGYGAADADSVIEVPVASDNRK